MLTATVFRSRWGFHPCDYATYRKLKLLHSVYMQSLQLAAAWWRWKRKDPHNRVMRRRIRNTKGQVIGYEAPVLMPEPKLCPLFTRKTAEKCYSDKNGNYSREGFMEVVVTDDHGIAGDFANARRPAKAESEVQALRVNLATINELHAQAVRWLADEA